MKRKKKEHGVRMMSKVLKVDKSGYYAWLRRPPSIHSQRDEFLLSEIKRIHAESRDNYGTLKTWKALKSQGVSCGKHRVARLRKTHGIESKRRKRFKVTTVSKNTEWIAPNLLNRYFHARQPNQVWIADVTFVATQGGWLYLAIVLDLYSRKVIGWSMSERNNKQLVMDALDMALERYRPNEKVIHHTDRGSTYGSDDYRNKLTAYGLVPSMSRKGDCYDNAIAESFFSTIKNELVYGQIFKTRDHARLAIFEFIEIFYNRHRLHQSLNYTTPEGMESQSVP